MYACFFASLFVCLFVCLFVYLFVRFCPPVCLAVCLFARSCVCLFVRHWSRESRTYTFVQRGSALSGGSKALECQARMLH